MNIETIQMKLNGVTSTRLCEDVGAEGLAMCSGSSFILPVATGFGSFLNTAQFLVECFLLVCSVHSLTSSQASASYPEIITPALDLIQRYASGYHTYRHAARTHTHTYTYTPTHKHTHTHASTRMNSHTHTHTHTHTLRLTNTQAHK